MWKVFSDPGRTTTSGGGTPCPYTIYTTGVAYRRDRIDDAAAAAAGYDLFFDPAFKDSVSYYDSYRDALGMMLLRDGVTDANSERSGRDRRRPRTRSCRWSTTTVRVSRSTASTRSCPRASSASPRPGRGTSWRREVLPAQGHPRRRPRLLVPGRPEGPRRQRHDRDPRRRAEPPRSAHEFLELLPASTGARDGNFSWNGYQPPMNSIVPDRLSTTEGVSSPTGEPASRVALDA